MEAWALYVAITCSEPRLPFRDFYQKAYHTRSGADWPTIAPAELTETVQKRIANGLADYVDYAEQYRDKCK